MSPGSPVVWMVLAQQIALSASRWKVKPASWAMVDAPLGLYHCSTAGPISADPAAECKHSILAQLEHPIKR